MKALFVILSISLSISIASAQSPKELIQRVNKKFGMVKDYTANIKMYFDIPSVRIDSLKGKVFYKQPSKFRIRTHGIYFLPKQNPYYAFATLADTASYTAVSTGNEMVKGVNCTIVTVIPLKEGDLLLGKFYIDATKNLVLKSELTTRSNGTIKVDNTYHTRSDVSLPDEMLLTVDVAKFKVPKLLAQDLNSKSQNNGQANKGAGTITLKFTGYEVNTKLDDKVFAEGE